jgi:hypothetical protein
MVNKELFDGLTEVLKSLNDNETYRNNPPQGPPKDWGAIPSSYSFDEINLNTFGERPFEMAPYDRDTLMLVEEDGIYPKNVPLPTKDMLSDINITAIDGSNERIERDAFYFILIRAALVNFRYNKEGFRPFSYQEVKDLSALTIADANLFDRNKLKVTTSFSINEDEKEIRKYIFGYLKKNDKAPLFVEYNRETNLNNPASHALGWGVKLMQTLELICLQSVKTDLNTICVKDGPIFSPSVATEDTKQLLRTIKEWDNQILIGCSKRISDSRLLVQLLSQKDTLRKSWFPNSDLTTNEINSISSDSVILSRHLQPGQRTALVQGVSNTRKKIVMNIDGHIGDPDLMPLNCYYLSRTRPYTYIRLEIPVFFYKRDPAYVENAIRIIAWQHELGKSAPLIQMLADKRCSLESEKQIIERITDTALKKRKLEFLQTY